MRYFVTIDGTELAVDVADLPGGGIDARLLDSADAEPGSGRTLAADVSENVRGLRVRVDGRVFDLLVEGRPPELQIFASGRRAQVRVESERQRAAAAVRSAGSSVSGGILSSPMPGKVAKVLVARGDRVESGAPLVVVEAMKMENELVSPRAGVIHAILVKPGDTVEGGAQLVEVRAAELEG
jgi:glutaconyl-CoA/methylmalonyl-CoA decarboxylase subunit gamma